MGYSNRSGILGLTGAALALGSLLSSVPEDIETSNQEPYEKKNSGNKSGHTPHQGKKEMARRLKRMNKNEN